jgi:hypothetical protein
MNNGGGHFEDHAIRISGSKKRHFRRVSNWFFTKKQIESSMAARRYANKARGAGKMAGSGGGRGFVRNVFRDALCRVFSRRRRICGTGMCISGGDDGGVRYHMPPRNRGTKELDYGHVASALDYRHPLRRWGKLSNTISPVTRSPLTRTMLLR